VSDLLEVRVIGAPDLAEQAVARLGGLLDLDRQRGPYPSRTTPGLVRHYLAGRLRPAEPPPPGREVERLAGEAARLRAAVELLTACDHGRGLDCPDCEPVPDLARQALSSEAAGPHAGRHDHAGRLPHPTQPTPTARRSPWPPTTPR
jgi:hypothetical protein